MVNSKIAETNTFKKAVYSVSVELPKEVHEVFNHLINLKNWWPEDFEGNEIHLNSDFILRSGDTHYSKNKVLEFIPDEKLVWITTDSIRKTDNFEWTGTKMIFELEPRNIKTILHFTYDGIVFENEWERLTQICDLTVKELFYYYLMKTENTK